jgi:hypothetical protein
MRMLDTKNSDETIRRCIDLLMTLCKNTEHVARLKAKLEAVPITQLTNKHIQDILKVFKLTGKSTYPGPDDYRIYYSKRSEHLQQGSLERASFEAEGKADFENFVIAVAQLIHTFNFPSLDRQLGVGLPVAKGSIR